MLHSTLSSAAVRLRTLALSLLVCLSLLVSSDTRAFQAVPTSMTGPTFSLQTGPLRIGIVGMVHDHVHGLLAHASKREDIRIVGVVEPDRALFDRLAARYKLDPSLYHASLEDMLDTAKPEAVSVMTSIRDHVMAVEACAPRGVHLLVEKPLAFSNQHAQRMAQLAAQHRVLVLTNYETSWYASVREAKRLVDSGAMAPVRKLIFRHGHKGPKEIGCSPKFLAWLTDPDANGGGAIVDFGCYGAILSTWLMNGARPTSVTASATTLKPAMYPRVDDDATIVIMYPGATSVVQASWAWTHDNKEMDVYTETGSVHAAKWDELFSRAVDGPREPRTPGTKAPHLQDEWTYLRNVVRGKCSVDPLSSLELNLIAVDILDQARRSAASARGQRRGRRHRRVTPAASCGRALQLCRLRTESRR
ncbi:MAG: Gfo/Idh/MocA family oxidoreductase [Phycisphaerae bacterium]|nr:Gfo/Idh/MocA family oxidoreductase [Phycisphaerae bacterium]